MNHIISSPESREYESGLLRKCFAHMFVAPEANIQIEWYIGPLGGGMYAWHPTWRHGARLIEPEETT